MYAPSRPPPRPSAFNRLIKSMITSFLITSILFVIGYFVLRDTVTQFVYRAVMDSNGAQTVGQYNQLGVLCLVGLFLFFWLIGIYAFYTDHAYNSFDFTEGGKSRRYAAVNPRITGYIDLYSLSPKEFEYAVARLIAQQGYRTRVVGGSNDRGVDVKVYDTDGRLIGVVQCKCYKPGAALPPAFIREMEHVRRTSGVAIAYLATTTHFSEASRRLAQDIGIRLIEQRDFKYITAEDIAYPATAVYNPFDPHTQYRPPAPSDQFPFSGAPQAPEGWVDFQRKPDHTGKIIPPPPKTYDERLRDTRRR